MAGLKVTVQSATAGFQALLKNFGGIRAEVMHFIGKKGHGILENDLLSGQELNLKRKPKDRAGRYTITNKVGRMANSVSIKSYPANLYERGRTLRDGKKQPGKRIITSKLKVLVEGHIQSWAGEAETGIIEKATRKA
jgi:hypothetical protein